MKLGVLTQNLTHLSQIYKSLRVFCIKKIAVNQLSHLNLTFPSHSPQRLFKDLRKLKNKKVIKKLIGSNIQNFLVIVQDRDLVHSATKSLN